MSPFKRWNLAQTGSFRREERPAALRYLAAFLLVTLSVMVGLWLRPVSYHSPYLFFFIAILLSLLYGGLGPGLFATLLSALLVHYFFLPPYGQFGANLYGWISGIYFCLSFGLICWLIDAQWQRAKGQIETQLELLEMTAEPITMRDEREEIIYWNRGAEIIYGWSSREAVGQRISELLRTVYPDPLSDIKHRLLSEGRWSGELKRTKKDGTEVFVRSTWTLHRATRGHITILEVDYDITEQLKIEARMREREEFYRDLVEHSTDLICTHTLDGRFLFVNELAAKILGYSREEMLERPMREFLLPEARGQFADALQRIQKEGFVKGLMIVLTKSGERRIWEYHNTLRSEGLATPIVRGIAHDITEQKHLERALRLSEEKFSKAFRSSPVEIAITTLEEGLFLDINEAFERESGFSREEIIGHTTIELGIWSNSADREAARDSIKKHGKLLNREIEFRTKTCKVTTKRCSAERVDLAGRDCLLVVFEDITERKEAEQALRASEENYRSIFAASFEAITVTDGTGNFEEVNEAACRMFGFSREELLRMTISDILVPEELPWFRQVVDDLAGRKVDYGEWRFRRKDGTMLLGEFGVTTMANGRLLGIGRDIKKRKRVEERLCILAQAVENSTELIAITNSEGVILAVNHALLGATGYQDEEVLGKHFGTTVISPNNPPHFSEDLLAKTLAGPGWTGECLSRRKDGSDFPTFLSTGQIRDSQGLLIGLYGISQDITVRKRAETELRENKDRLQIALELTDTGMWELNLEDHSAYRSLRHDQIFGYESPLPEWTYEKFLEHVLPECRAEINQKFQDSVASGIWEFDTRIRRVDGEVRWIWARGRQLVDESGRATRMFGTVMDITQHKQIEEGLHLNEERLRLAQISAGLELFEVELSTGKRTWSPQVFQIFGLPADAPNSSLEDSFHFTHPDDRALVEQQTALLISGKPVHFEHRIVHPGGDVRWVEIFGSPECDQAGKPIRYIGTCRDVTERKQLEAQLRQAQKMEAIGQLAGGVAHDFNNLMGVILGYSDLLTDRTLTNEVYHKRLESIRVAVRSAAAVTRQLLAFSRKQVLQPVILDLNTAVHQLNKMIRRLIGEDIQVAIRLEPNLGFVKADPGQVEQVLMNLVVNARDAMPEGGDLQIETANVELTEEFAKLHLGSQAGAFVRLSVRDTGVGMNKQVLAHIFEPFFTTKEIGRGTGLGLATVYGIVKQSEGYIGVESEPGKGTAFEIYLPRVESKPATERPRQAVNIAHGSETILLVEDENALRELTQVQLETLGYQVLAARDAEAALGLYAKHGAEVSLLLTDVIMPGMNGRVLGDRLREKNPELRILFMSGYTDDEILRKGLSDPDQAILVKPFPREVLASRIREILDRKLKQPDDGPVES